MARQVSSGLRPTLARPAYRWAVLIYDRVYRFAHGLDRAASEIGPVLRIEVCPCRRGRRLPDGTQVRRGDRIGILHLNNARIATLHACEPSVLGTGLEFRRLVLASLRALAVQVGDGGRLGAVTAVAALTIFHEPLERLGFQPEPDGVVWPRLVAFYQRALLACLHPRARVSRSGYRRARRLWISRPALLARYGDGRAAEQRRGMVPRPAA